MTHREAISAMLAGSSDVDAPRTADPEVARHLSRCSDCWAVVRVLHAALTGTRPAGDARMSALLGCEEVQERLPDLVTQPLETLIERDVAAARHLGWCPACRERLVDLVDFTRALESGEIPPLAPGWIQTVEENSRTHRSVGRLGISVRRGLAWFSEIPFGFVEIVSAPVLAMRGPEGGGIGSTAAVRALEFATSNRRVKGEVLVSASGPEEVRLALRVVAPAVRGMVRLRSRAPDGGGALELLAAESLRADAPILFPSVPLGRYVVEIADSSTNEVYLVEVAVSSARIPD